MGTLSPTVRRMLAVVSCAALAAVAAPGTASAATTTSVVGAVVGSELSLAAATPAAMTMTHSTPGTSSSVVTVTSTQLSWTLSIADNNTGANSGHMLKTVGAAPLAGALEWSPDNATFSSLSGSPATVGTGSLVGTKNVYFRQALGASEDVAAGDNYTITVAYTVA